MNLKQRFESYREQSDPSIAISDAQASWVMEFVERELAKPSASLSEKKFIESVLVRLVNTYTIFQMKAELTEEDMEELRGLIRECVEYRDSKRV